MVIIRRGVLALAVVALLLAEGAVPVSAALAAAPPGTTCSAVLFDGDRRLGPQDLPRRGEVGRELRGYQRTGSLTEAAFLATFWDPAANFGQGGFRFPPDNGYVIGPNGQPEVSPVVLPPDSRLDRFGSELGGFLAPEGLAYAARSIPPQSLVSNPAAGCNLHEYTVERAFEVDTGPIAPWFAQPGGGRQFQLVSGLVPGAPTPLNVMWLVNNGFLERLS
jgi:nicrotizing toxin Mtb-like protein